MHLQLNLISAIRKQYFSTLHHINNLEVFPFYITKDCVQAQFKKNKYHVELNNGILIDTT